LLRRYAPRNDEQEPSLRAEGEAIQFFQKPLDCFVASLHAMTEMEAADDRYFRLGDIDIAIILMRDGESLDLPR
jgi:hypothetical protein